VDRKWAWSTPGNVRIGLPDLPLKYGLDTISRSEVIELTVFDFLGEKLGNSPPLSPLLLFLAIEKNVTPPARPNGTL